MFNLDIKNLTAQGRARVRMKERSSLLFDAEKFEIRAVPVRIWGFGFMA